MVLNQSVRYFKADCSVESVLFDSQDIASAFNIFNAYSSIDELPKSFKQINKISKDKVRVDFLGALDYKELNRIQRAYRFLKTARESSVLPAKISYYVLILECLFSANDLGEIQHKIGERVAYYLSQEYNERKNIYEQVKSVYAIRSKYVHGQTLSKSNSEPYLKEMAIKLDELVRKILTNVILKDSQMFLQKDEKLTDWFKELLFQK